MAARHTVETARPPCRCPICHRYDSENLGLADPYSTPDQEIAYLLGSPFEHITLPRRNASYTATVILDLAAIDSGGRGFWDRDPRRHAAQEFAGHDCSCVLALRDCPGHRARFSRGMVSAGQGVKVITDLKIMHPGPPRE